jgi:hypothetical protein
MVRCLTTVLVLLYDRPSWSIEPLSMDTCFCTIGLQYLLRGFSSHTKEDRSFHLPKNPNIHREITYSFSTPLHTALHEELLASNYARSIRIFSGRSIHKIDSSQPDGFQGRALDRRTAPDCCATHGNSRLAIRHSEHRSTIVDRIVLAIESPEFIEIA